MNGIPTFTDPGTQLSNSNFIADALLSNNQSYSANTLRFLASGGLLNIKIVKKSRTNKIILIEVSTPTVYLMLTNQMTDWMPSISKLEGGN